MAFVSIFLKERVDDGRERAAKQDFATDHVIVVWGADS